MSIEEFTGSLYQEMEQKLSEINGSEKDELQITRDSVSSILQFISRLKMFVQGYDFASNLEEINFFKNIKPKFLSKLIYYRKVFNIQSRLPLGTLNDVRDYYFKELRKISAYFNNNNEFVIYYKSNSKSFDELYFVRKEPDSWLLLNFEDYETDLSFTTIYDHKVSKIIAFELITEFIKTSLDRTEARNANMASEKISDKPPINWTGSKVSLIELLYALQSTGSINHGKMDLRQLANHLEHLFNIDLGNYYRVFQEIRIRKINRTVFLDRLRDRLIQRMDETDENPKFK